MVARPPHPEPLAALLLAGCTRVALSAGPVPREPQRVGENRLQTGHRGKPRRLKSTEFKRFSPGVAYYGYRWYDPQTGRWPSMDSIEEQGGVNLYGLLGNDGINQVDLLGMEALTKDPKEPKIPDGKKIEEFNCGGLAFKTYGWMTPEDAKHRLEGKHCNKVSCDTQCADNEIKFWYWHIKKVKGWKGKAPKPVFWKEFDVSKLEDDYHIVAHPGDCATCYAKDNINPIVGPVDPRSQKPGDVTYELHGEILHKYQLTITEACYCCK